MNRDKSLTAASLTYILALALSLLFLTLACSRTEARKFYGIETKADRSAEAAVRPERKEVAAAPWQHWSNATLGSPSLLEAERYVSVGDLEAATVAYRKAQVGATAQVYAEASLRLSGTLLKLGRMQEALAEISRYSKKQNLAPDKLDPRFSLVASYAYLGQRNYDQALAWFGVVHRIGRGQGVHARRAQAEAERILVSIPQAEFGSYAERWAGDLFVGPLFNKERLRRAKGGAIAPGFSLEWFSPQVYQPQVSTKQSGIEQRPTVEQSLSGSSAALEAPSLTAGVPLKFGVLLPLTDRFAQHGALVKQGIELALSAPEVAGQAEAVYVDTAGDPLTAAREYDRLVQQERVLLVLGPLLVKTSEEVAGRASVQGVPFISFTKKEGITSLSPQFFRLGATASDQVRELVLYAAGQEKLGSFASISSDSPAQVEYVRAFDNELRAETKLSLKKFSYLDRDTVSVQSAVDSAALHNFGAIFVPGTLEEGFEVLSSLKSSPLSSSLILGSALWYDTVALSGYGQLIDGAVFAVPFFRQSREPQVEKFVLSYRERFSAEPDLLSAQAYDAVMLALNAIKGPNGCPSGDIPRCLRESRSYLGVTGAMTVEPNGEIRRRMAVLRIYRGEIFQVVADGKPLGYLPEGGQVEQGSSE